MASELSEARTKTITNKLIDNIIAGIEESGDLGAAEREAKTWWEDHRVELVGLAIAEVTAILGNAKKKKNLAKKYDQLVASMSWKERLAFMQGGIDELRASNSKKIRTAALISEVLKIGIKVLPIILAAV